MLLMRLIAGHPLWVGNVDDAVDVGGLHAIGILAVVDLAMNELPAVSMEAVLTKSRLLPTTNELKP